MTDWARDWNKQWFTADAGSVVFYRTAATSNGMYKPVLWAIKDRLVSPGVGAWTVLASSGKAGGGSLVASTDDNWLSGDDLVGATSDTGDRAWILLKSPTTRWAGTFYLLIDYWGTNELYTRWYFTKSQPDISSPAINARPPATGDEWSHSTYILRSSDSSQFITSLYAVRANDGSFFFAACAPFSTSHTTVGTYMLNVMRATKPWDTTKAVSLILTNYTTGRIQYSTTLSFQSLHSDGSQVTVEPVWFRSMNQVSMVSVLTDPITGKWLTWQVPMVCTTSGKKTFRGELEDIYWSGDPGGEGTLMFANEVVKAIRLGPFTVPFDQLGGAP